MKRMDFKIMTLEIFLLSLLISGGWCDLTFPPGFKFGAATAAYQIEGDRNYNDRSENIWDHVIRQRPGAVLDGKNASVACDSLHLWKRDVEIAKDLGLDFYRFSLSWTRLLPTGFSNRISSAGKKYYNELIDELLRHGIEPVVTLYHFDLPQRLQNLGGWTNPLIAEWFADFARVAYSLYADRVKTWITINEPNIMCDLNYNTGLLSPGVKDPEMGINLCSRHVLLAHAKAWRMYDAEYKHKYHGRVSITTVPFWYEPASEDDQEVTELTLQFGAGRYSHPIYSKEGGWPPAMEKIIAENSRRDGFPRSRLPPFTDEEIQLIKGTFDFYALNYYTSRVVRKSKPGEESPGFDVTAADDLDVVMVKPQEWKAAPNDWLLVYPEGIRKLLGWLKKEYGPLNFFITENGYAYRQQGINDDDRVEYIRDHLKQILLAIKEDGVNVTTYTAWSLMDNFEWFDGFKTKFGLYEVDFSSPELTRTPRKSALYYKHIIKSRSLIEPTKYKFDELYLYLFLFMFLVCFLVLISYCCCNVKKQNNISVAIPLLTRK